jgi:hypothetical protein
MARPSAWPLSNLTVVKEEVMSKYFYSMVGGSIAVILLLLYCVSMYFIITAVPCGGGATCPKTTDGTVFVVTTVGGLVSALVISLLAVTNPGENPGAKLVAANAGPTAMKVTNVVVILYLVVWVVTGLAALVVGVMLYPGIDKTLGDSGTTWFGVAVAAGYSYFGIKPK